MTRLHKCVVRFSVPVFRCFSVSAFSHGLQGQHSLDRANGPGLWAEDRGLKGRDKIAALHKSVRIRQLHYLNTLRASFARNPGTHMYRPFRADRCVVLTQAVGPV
jgi:hypothetical protein